MTRRRRADEDVIVVEPWDGDFLDGARRSVFLIQRAVLSVAVMVGVAGILFGVNFLVNLEELALENSRDRLATHVEAYSEAVSRVQDSQQRVLAQLARNIIAETGPMEDRVRRMENLERVFQMTRAWQAVAAQQAKEQWEEKLEGLTFFVSPIDGKVTPLNPTSDGSLDMNRLASAGNPADLDYIMALVRQRAEGEVQQDQKGFVLIDLEEKMQKKR